MRAIRHLTLSTSLAVLVIGCGASGSDPHKGEIDGKMVDCGGPAFPGHPNPCFPEPNQVLRVVRGGVTVARGHSSGNGAFSFSLSPGTYTVIVGSEGGPTTPQRVTVRAGQHTDVTLGLGLMS